MPSLAREGETSYKRVYIDDVLYLLGDVVQLEGADDDSENVPMEGDEVVEVVPEFGLVQYIGADKAGRVEVQVRSILVFSHPPPARPSLTVTDDFHFPSAP